jgi:hypothetical protein
MKKKSTYLVVPKKDLGVRRALGFVRLLEKSASSRTVSETVRHIL